MRTSVCAGWSGNSGRAKDSPIAEEGTGWAWLTFGPIHRRVPGGPVRQGTGSADWSDFSGEGDVRTAGVSCGLSFATAPWRGPAASTTPNGKACKNSGGGSGYGNHRRVRRCNVGDGDCWDFMDLTSMAY